MSEETNNRNQKRVRRLTAVFVVAITLLIVGVSYAYFTATANNNNNQQINLETGTLSLIFSDNNNGFNVQLSPGGSAEKTFTIRNNGNKEAAASMSFVNLINTYLADSLIYSLSYSETQNGTYKYLNIDNVPTSSTRVTREISNGIIVPANTTYYYKLRIKLVNLRETDQTSDLSATMNTKFRIDAVNLPDNTGKSDQTLQKLHSLNNTITVTSGTPDFQYTNEGKMKDSSNNEITNNSKISNGIYAMEDDYGTSYYFRGNVSNNYVHFGGYYWRIIRINGDGTLRLLYDGTTAGAGTALDNVPWTFTNFMYNADAGFMFGYEPNTEVNYTIHETGSYEESHMNKMNSNMKDYLEYWYVDSLTSDSSKIADSIFCNDRSYSTTTAGCEDCNQQGYGTGYAAYGSYGRYVNKTPSLKCPQRNDAFTVNDSVKGNGRLTSPIGLITLDELMLAGNGSTVTTSAYTYKDILSYRTFSPELGHEYTSMFYILSNTYAIYSYQALDFNPVVPVINLTQDAVMSMTGSGTQASPFEA